ncbi:LPD7 domain-containing protein [Klebsiella aerogenes]|uniref:LPD7 domain-containing protein n=1 Tax=Klebsiella aerogenes TaxID=548 RepID=UPI000665A40D|nr:LPD7 domain-containing protein [Klebsiella aerogenes]
MVQRTYLAIDKTNRTEAFRAAGKLPGGENALEYDPDRKAWFAKAGADLDRIKKWLPENAPIGAFETHTTGLTPAEEFAEVLRDAGFLLPAGQLPEPFGGGKKVNRLAVEGDAKGKTSGVYRFYNDGHPSGWYENHRTSTGVVKWVSQGQHTVDPAQRLQQQAQNAQRLWDREQKTQAEYNRQAAWSTRQWETLPPAPGDHPYLVRKDVPAADGLRLDKYQNLVIPLRNPDGNIRSLQYIAPDGTKLIKRDSEKAGNFFVVGGQLEAGKPVLYAEGYATAATVSLASGLPVVMTVDAGNLVTVATALKARYPDAPHLIFGDDDYTNRDNAGRTDALRAAELTGGHYLLPVFTEEERQQAFDKQGAFSDFNDLYHAQGPDAVRAQITPFLDAVIPDWRPALTDTPQENTMSNIDNDDLNQDAPPPLTPEQREAYEQYLDDMATRDITENPEVSPAIDEPVMAEDRIILPEDVPEPVLSAAPEANIPAGVPGNDAPAPETPTTAPIAETPEVVQPPAEPEPVISQPDAGIPALSEQNAPITSSTPADDIPSVASLLNRNGGEPEENQTAESLPQTEPEVAADMAPPSPPAEPVDDIPAEPESLPPVEDIPSVASRLNTPPQTNTDDTPDEPVVERAPGQEAAAQPAAAEPDGFTFAPQEKGPSFTSATPEPLLNLDEIMKGLTSEKADHTFVYSLKGEKAFVDHGDRITMATPEASKSDEKVLAALMVASHLKRGVIELTGSDVFKEKAIGLIARYDLKITLRDPLQAARLEELRKPAEVDTLKTNVVPDVPETGTPADTPPAGATPPEATRTAAGPETAAKAQPDMPVSPSAPESATKAPATVPETGATASPEKTAAAAPVEQPEDIRQGLSGKLLAFGPSPYLFEKENGPSYYATLRTKEGVKTYWGKELETAIAGSGVSKGEAIKLKFLGSQPVTINIPVKDEAGKTVGWEPKDTHRNQWSVTPMVNRARLAADEKQAAPPASLHAYDANAFWALQKQVISRAGLTLDCAPPKGHGLIYLQDNGKGARAPATPPENVAVPGFSRGAGSVIMQAFNPDGQCRLHLVKAHGDYLQGVVRHKGELKHVIGRLSQKEDGSPYLTLNSLSPDGTLNPVAQGNALNRVKGAEVSFDKYVFRISGEKEKCVATLNNAEGMPAALHKKLGFTQPYTPPQRQETPENAPKRKVQPAQTLRPGM